MIRAAKAWTTSLSSSTARKSSSGRDEAAATLLRHKVEASEIADAVLYLAQARSVTGQMIAVDAGQHLGWRTPDIIG